jgi:hypothetical protein
MKRWTLTASGLGMFLLAIVATIAAQEPRKGAERAPQGDDRPQRKGMMGGGMMMGNMPMQGMMPMMMEMHQRHAAMESQWEATDDGVFVLRPGQLLKYDGDLKLVKSVDLPEAPMPMMQHLGGGDDAAGMPKMKMDPGRMRQMMAQMHAGLPSRLDVTRDAIFVSRGNSLLKFSRDLELQKKTDLPEVKPMMCPMCGQMMGGHMQGDMKE